MKRIITILMLSGLLLVFTACGQSQQKLSYSAGKVAGEETAGNEASSSESDNTGRIEAQSGGAEKESVASDITADAKDSGKTDRAAEAAPKAKTGIIAKSDNIVASEDKAGILKKLDNELDELFSSMNELEDLQDSDLE